MKTRMSLLFMCCSSKLSGSCIYIPAMTSEASYAVHARAITDHHNLYDPNSLSFKEGDYIKVLEQRADGNWKGYVMHDGHRRIGHFPSQAVVLVDSQAVVKNLPHLRYSSGHLMSPQVPDLINNKHNHHHHEHAPGNSNHLSNEHIHNPYGSIGLDRTFPPPPSPLALPKSPSRDSDRDSGISPQHPMPPHGFSQSSQYLHASPGSPDGHPDWHNGEYVNHLPPSRSPTQGSPASSNRNSAASTGSGGYLLGHNNYVNVAITSQHRLSGQSYESGVSGVSVTSSRQSYHSNSSSSSLGSLDRLEESGYSSTVNVHELFQAGLSDGEVLRAWLADLHFEEYYHLFIQAGYDMPTISRMTPEDLTAIGITKPAHRKRLKAEISKLHIHDGIPDFKPGDIGEWCRLLGLEQYLACLVHQGYDHIDSVTDITWEDLEDVGIKLLGHQKKMMLAIERLKRIQSGSRRLSTLDKSTSGSETALEPPSSYPTPQWLIEQQGSGPQHFHHSQLAAAAAGPRTPGSPGGAGGGHYHHPIVRPPPGSPSPYGSAQEVAIYTKPKRSPSGENLCSKPSLELSTFQGSTEHLRGKTKLVYQPDVVAIQVNRNTPVRTGSTSDDGSGTQQQVIYESFKGPAGSPAKVRSSTDDNVFTFSSEHTNSKRPSMERTYSDDLDGLATIRRPSAKVSPRVAPKPKPVAKIVAKTKRTSRDFKTTDIIKIHNSDSIENYKSNATNSLDRKLSFNKQYGSEKIYDAPTVPGTTDLQKPLYISTSQANTTGPGSPHSPGHYAVSPVSSGSGGSGGSPTGKKAPPPPPKRTNSIKSDHPPHSLRKGPTTPSGNGTPQSTHQYHASPTHAQFSPNHQQQLQGREGTPPRPPLPQNYVSSNIQQQQPQAMSQPQHHFHQQQQHTQNSSFQNCVKSLSERFESSGGDAGASAGAGGRRGSSESSTSISSLASVPDAPHYTPSQNEDFPPPPPPLSGSPPGLAKAAPQGHYNTSSSSKAPMGDNDNPLSDVIEQLQGRPAARGPQQQTHSSEWNDSDGSDSDSGFESVNRKSGSSIGSTACPTGSTDTLPFANENVGTIKSRSQNSKPSIVTVSNGEGEDGDRQVDLDSSFFEDSGTIKRKPKSEKQQQQQQQQQQQPVQQRNSTVQGQQIRGAEAGAAAAQSKDGKAGDVLNDIGNMLQDLTDELDAMLEFELE